MTGFAFAYAVVRVCGGQPRKNPGAPKCRKASASSGAEYYMKLDCMKKHEGLFWLTPEILFAIEKFPKYMKIMPQKLNNSQLEGIGVSFR